ncbi:MAG: phosphoribosyltransferase [Candidatus Staskawiczbacteria bacterium]|nr:phosphoribosyltransferase [Candidatus Staskawiczbacteria bacterium]
MKETIEIVATDHLKTLGNCGGYYSCPKDPSGKRLGPLVCYAGDYELPDGSRKKFVGDVYVNFAKAEPFPNVRRFFAGHLCNRLASPGILRGIDVFCGAPIGGYSLADAIGDYAGIPSIKAEKQVIEVKTATSKEVSEVIFGRHSVKAGQRVAIVEDVCNNFSTTLSLILKIEKLGAQVVAIVCFLNRSLTLGDVYCPGANVLLRSGERRDMSAFRIPVVSLVRLPINEWKQDDPAVAEDVAKNNVAWDPKKKDWERLMEAMHAQQ